MFSYFIRRILLIIPTFLGCTLVVFTIVQLAPGGPLEQQLMALKRGSTEGGGATNVQGQSLPAEALDELKRFYGFDKPIVVRYLIWLGVWERESDTYGFVPDTRRLIGDGKSVVVSRAGSGWRIVDADNPSVEVHGWNVGETTNDSGQVKYHIFRKEYSGILTGNFGKSYTYRKPVLELVKDRMPVSIQFGLISLILSYIVCVYLGIQKALGHNSRFDLASSSIVFVAYSVPGWALGAVLVVVLCTNNFLPWFPLGGFQDKMYSELNFFEKVMDRASHFVLPLVSYSLGGFATLTMLMKNSLLENLSQDYVRTAFAKGIREQRVIWLHAMRNSIIPIAAGIGYLISILIAGSYLIESVFNIDGIGKLSFEAIVSRDYPIVFCFTVITVVITLIGSIISDLVVSLIDPRIRYK